MGTYEYKYESALKEVERVKCDIITSVVNCIKTIATKPFRIDDNWYYIVNENGKEVPGYCHASDYKPKNPKFLPIYTDGSYMGGCIDFKDACRYYERIVNHLNKR